MARDHGDHLDFDQRLNEAIFWCTHWVQSAQIALNPQVLQHVAKMKKAAELRQSASRSNWFTRYITNRGQYELGTKMLNEAIEAVLGLTRLFRSSAIAQIDTSSLHAPDAWDNAVLSVAQARRALNQGKSFLGDCDQAGRLLICEPSSSVWDGASESFSAGFFDINDIPPGDTWVDYKDGKLMCWIPKELVWLADLGIEVNPVECIYWA